MEQLLEFAANHYILTIALVVVTGAIIATHMSDRLRGINSVDAVEATRLINHEKAIVLDVREDKEYQEGHILNAIHIPLGSLEQRVKELEKHKEKPVIINCRSGHRSGNACVTLKKHGFINVYNLGGGIMAWQNANYPVTK
jgi:rhodanese-related sulfurtransferase